MSSVLLLLGACATDGQTGPSGASLLPTATELARTAERQSDWEGAARHWQAALAAAPGDHDATLALARALRLSGNCGPAASVLGELLTKTPNDPDALVEGAKCALVSARPEAAEDQLHAAIDAAPDSWEAETTLALVYDRLGRYVEAQAHHDRAVSLAPDRPIVLSNKALSLALAGNIAEALPLMRKAAASPTATARVRMNLAMLEAMAGHGDRASAIASQEMLSNKTDTLSLLRRMASEAATTVGKP